MKFSNYQIVENPSIEATITEVEQLLDSGWVPIGGIEVSMLDETSYYAQAMGFPTAGITS